MTDPNIERAAVARQLVDNIAARAATDRDTVAMRAGLEAIHDLLGGVNGRSRAYALEAASKLRHALGMRGLHAKVKVDLAAVQGSDVVGD
jgi:hypothetical protein